MKLYWGIHSIPELHGLPKTQQRRLWQTYTRTAFRMPRVWGSYALMAIMVMAVSAIPILLDIVPSGTRVFPIWSGLSSGLGFVICNQILIRAMRPLLAIHRRALEPRERNDDSSYYVPPAF